MVGVGPVFKLDRRVGEMLHRMDDDRPAALGDRKNALDAQQVGSAQSGQYGHRLLEHRPRNGLVEKQREAIETVGVLVVAEIEFAVRRCWLVKDELGCDPAVIGDHQRRWVQRCDFCGQIAYRVGISEIALGQDDMIGERHLFSRLGHAREVARRR